MLAVELGCIQQSPDFVPTEIEHGEKMISAINTGNSLAHACVMVVVFIGFLSSLSTNMCILQSG